MSIHQQQQKTIQQLNSIELHVDELMMQLIKVQQQQLSPCLPFWMDIFSSPDSETKHQMNEK